jgi:amphi-Trp domain-containing protein
MKDTLFKSDARMSRKEAADYLRTLADRVEENKVVLKDGQSETSVELPEELELEVDYSTKQKKGNTRYQLELELKWGPAKGGLGLA